MHARVEVRWARCATFALLVASSMSLVLVVACSGSGSSATPGPGPTPESPENPGASGDLPRAPTGPCEVDTQCRLEDATGCNCIPALATAPRGPGCPHPCFAPPCMNKVAFCNPATKQCGVRAAPPPPTAVPSAPSAPPVAPSAPSAPPVAPSAPGDPSSPESRRSSGAGRAGS